jgi:integrase
MCTHLTRRDAIYYFRRVIPRHLRAAFDGKQEWTYSLGTKDRGAAKKLAQAETVRTNGLLDQACDVRIDAPCPPPEVFRTSALPAPASKADGAGAMLDVEIVDLWAAERKVQAQGIQMYRAAARWLYERVGRKPVDQITKRDILSFKAKLVAEGCTAANIKNKLSRLRTLLQWAAENAYVASNVADNVIIKDPDAAKNKRRSLDLASLNALFSSPIYTKGERPLDSRSGGEAAYWLPLLALFTGARREELGQLRPDDVVRLTFPDPDGKAQSAWFFKLIEIDDEGKATTLKNAASERLVPIHPELERLGFIRFALAMKEQGRVRIFHRLKSSKFGRLTDKWGQWFTLYRRETCGITDRRMVFHSFRHTFKDYARHAGIVEAVQRQIMGHSGDDVADDYGSGHSLYRLVEGIRLYRVPGLTTPHCPPEPPR